MIKYLQFKEKYLTQVYNLIENSMLNELKIDVVSVLKTTKDLEWINDKYIKKGGNFWIAIDEAIDEVIGTVAIMKLDEENAEFKRFYVRKDYRNKSIGYDLYKIAENYAKENKFKYLYLSSGKDLKKAHRIYNINGWNLIDKNDNKVNIFVRKEAKLFRKKL